jgi:cell filamentation protein
MAKGDTRFAKHEYIEAEGLRLFQEFKPQHYLGASLPFAQYIEHLAHYYSELNVLHPFREGNGRSIRTFLSVIAYQSGRMYIDWEKVSPEENTAACIKGYLGDESELAGLLQRVTFEIDK